MHMPKRAVDVRAVAALLLSLALTVPITGAASEQADDIKGRVVDHRGAAIPHAEVFLYRAKMFTPSNRPVVVQKADAKGRFHFRKAIVWDGEASPGDVEKYVVFARAEGHGPDFRAVLPGDPLTGVTVALPGPGPRTVTVRDDQGNPVEGAHVFLSLMYHERVNGGGGLDVYHRHAITLWEDIGLSSGATDANGQITLLSLNHREFVATKPGYIPARIRENDSGVLIPGGQVEGRVTFEDGSPAPRALVRYSGDGLPVFTDADGHYRIDGIPATTPGQKGIPRLRALISTPRSPFESDAVPVTAQAGDTTVQDLVLKAIPVTPGRTIDRATGRPAPGIHLLQTVSDAKGRFFARADEYVQAYLSDPGYGALLSGTLNGSGEDRVVQMPDPQNRGEIVLKVNLLPVKRLHGKVLDAMGKPVKGARVFTYQRMPVVESDATGRFELFPFPADRDVTLYVAAPDQSHVACHVVARKSRRAVVTLRPSMSCSGEVVTIDGAPVPNALIGLELMPNSMASTMFTHDFHTDDRGRFTVDKLCPGGRYHVSIKDIDIAHRARYAYTSPWTTPAEPFRIVLAKLGGELRGVVKNSSGAPIPNADIRLLPSYAAFRESGKACLTKTGPDGAFSFPDVAIGPLFLDVNAPDYVGACVAVKAPAEDVAVTLSTARPATRPYVLHVWDDAGRPVAGAPLTVRTWATDDSAPEETRLTTDAQGICPIVLEGARALQEGVVLCAAPGYAIGICGLQRDQIGERVIQLRRNGASPSGCIEDEDGRPIRNAKIRLRTVGSPANGVPPRLTPLGPAQRPTEFDCATDRYGRFAFPAFSAEDEITLAVEKKGYRPVQSTPIRLTGDRPILVTMTRAPQTERQ